MGSAANAEPVFPPGSRVGLEPPAGLNLSKRFPGFEDPDRQAAIAILDLPGPADRFEYAVLYRHGVVTPARTYDFWDNNGGLNHLFVKGGYVLPSADSP